MKDPRVIEAIPRTRAVPEILIRPGATNRNRTNIILFYQTRPRAARLFRRFGGKCPRHRTPLSGLAAWGAGTSRELSRMIRELHEEAEVRRAQRR
jgi:hypothetical protein